MQNTEEILKNNEKASTNSVLNSDETSNQPAEPDPSPTQLHSCHITYIQGIADEQIPTIMNLVREHLSEPYSIYVYRYFIHSNPDLCYLAKCNDACVGVIICKQGIHCDQYQGYIGMLVVDESHRNKQIGITLVRSSIIAMRKSGILEVSLETEISNKAALKLYWKLGFIQDQRLSNYYLNGGDAFRLKLWL